MTNLVDYMDNDVLSGLHGGRSLIKITFSRGGGGGGQEDAV